MTIGVESDEEQTATMVKHTLTELFDTDQVFVSYLDPRRSDDLFQVLKDYMGSHAATSEDFYAWVKRTK
jgi:hypothetical protein